ncbi:winged helix-turn-helix transcriptional regulator [Bordetella genomosp. 4]|uniref:Transcriptional regulator n=1 Tax=Bordetella genomosp. 4 TaxID=463044 RepID=A0A261TMA6_9BORD|nr:winged helix-turn-helix transcriptional regulator [Bordetella genomosp. 4]OZI50784.1 transcriptional regulator [Bordetella genomosp. 4]
MRKQYTAETAASGVEEMIRLLDGRWKLIILFHLFDGKVQRYSDFERLIPSISQKMLAQQLRQLERDGLVARKLYPQVPPKVEYRLTEWGQALCPALDAILRWAEQRDGRDGQDRCQC